jgi:serine/threonine-protein kinase RsbW
LENGWSQNKIGHVKIALDEILVNAIMHGNLCSDRYVVNVSHILYRDILEVYIADEGVGFGSFNIAQRFTEEDLLKESGRGLFMASKYATKMYFNETGNKCWTIFTKF